jgi:hypothetical protein
MVGHDDGSGKIIKPVIAIFDVLEDNQPLGFVHHSLAKPECDKVGRALDSPVGEVTFGNLEGSVSRHTLFHCSR